MVFDSGAAVVFLCARWPNTVMLQTEAAQGGSHGLHWDSLGILPWTRGSTATKMDRPPGGPDIRQVLKCPVSRPEQFPLVLVQFNLELYQTSWVACGNVRGSITPACYWPSFDVCRLLTSGTGLPLTQLLVAPEGERERREGKREEREEGV